MANSSTSEDGSAVVRQNWTDFPHPSVAVVETIAATIDRDPTEIEPLHRTADMDALDALLVNTDETTDLELSFFHEGVEVVVRSSGTVEVYTE